MLLPFGWGRVRLQIHSRERRAGFVVPRQIWAGLVPPAAAHPRAAWVIVHHAVAGCQAVAGAAQLLFFVVVSVATQPVDGDDAAVKRPVRLPSSGGGAAAASGALIPSRLASAVRSPAAADLRLSPRRAEEVFLGLLLAGLVPVLALSAALAGRDDKQDHQDDGGGPRQDTDGDAETLLPQRAIAVGVARDVERQRSCQATGNLGQGQKQESRQLEGREGEATKGSSCEE